MIRLGFTLLSALTAIAAAVAGCISSFTPIALTAGATPVDSLTLHFYDGRVRLFWIQSLQGAIEVEHARSGPFLHVWPKNRADSVFDPEFRDRPTWSIRIGNRFNVPAFGAGGLFQGAVAVPAGAPVMVQFVRAPLWVIVLPLLYPAVMAVFRGPMRQRRRRKRNQCIKCGYNLTGLTEPRCPECGTPIQSSVPPVFSSFCGRQ